MKREEPKITFNAEARFVLAPRTGVRGGKKIKGDGLFLIVKAKAHDFVMVPYKGYLWENAERDVAEKIAARMNAKYFCKEEE